MVEIKTSWTEENLKEYYKYTFFAQKVLPKALLVILPVLYLIIVIYCIIVYINMQFVFTLIFAIVMTVVFALSGLLFVYMLKSIIKNTLKANENSEFNRAVISKDTIILFKDEKPYGELDWEKIKKISVNEKYSAVYLSTEENAVLILESKNIINGTWDSLKEIAKEKNDKLPKKA